MPGKNFDTLAAIAADQQGLVSTADARAAGIDPHRLIDMERRGTLERVGHGLYRFPLLDTTPELGQLAQATMWAGNRGILSHDTALDAYELCDINPIWRRGTEPFTKGSRSSLHNGRSSTGSNRACGPTCCARRSTPHTGAASSGAQSLPGCVVG